LSPTVDLRAYSFSMSVREVTFWFAIVLWSTGVSLPVALWIKRGSAVPAELFAIPALVIGSWWFAEIFGVAHMGTVGFTFYGAVVSNLLMLLRFRTFQAHRLLWGALVAGGCVVVGLTLDLLLPAIAE
jgi:hypothetical protein